MDTKRFTEKQQRNLSKACFQRFTAIDWGVWIARRHYPVDHRNVLIMLNTYLMTHPEIKLAAA